MITKDELGKKIREGRINAGLSQKDLGEILRCSHAAISDIERGKTNLTVTDLSLIADRLNKPIEYFLNIHSDLPNIIISSKGHSNENIESGEIKLNIQHNSITI